MQTFEGSLPRENAPKSQTRQLTPEQAEILHRSFVRTQKAANSFSTNYESLFSIIDSGLHKQVDQYIRIKDKKPKIKKFTPIDKSTAKEVVDIEAIVSIAKANNFGRDDIIKLVEEAIACKAVDISELKSRGISLDLDDTFYLEKKKDKILKIVSEFKNHGIEAVDTFYKIGQKIDEIKDLNDLFSFQTKLSETYPNQPSLFLRRANQQINIKAAQLGKAIEKNIAPENPILPDLEYDKYHQLLDEALEYLDFLYPKKNKSRLIKESYKALAKGRDNTLDWVPFLKKYYASCPALVKVFWSKQLQRDIENPESIGLTREIANKLRKFIFDKKLMSETGAWSQTTKIEKENLEMKFYAENPSTALVIGIQQYLAIPPEMRNGNPEGDRITIIVNDNRLLKLFLKPKSTDADIERAIQEAEKQAIDVSDPKLKYRLKTDAYRPKNHSEEYLKIYQHQEQLKIAGILVPDFINNLVNEPKNGDYIFRLTTKADSLFNDKNSPFSMYTVDSNKALIDIDLTGPERGEARKVSMKHFHSHFDADNQSKVFDNYVDVFLNQAKRIRIVGINELPKFSTVEQAQKLNIPSMLSSEFEEYPYFESIRSDLKDKTLYKAIEINIEEQPHKIPANIVRDIVSSLEEDSVEAVYTLYKVSKPPTDTNPCHDEISPVTIGLAPIRKSFEEYVEWRKTHDDSSEKFDFGNNLPVLTEWFIKTEKAIKRSKEGRSYQAIVAAPTDRLARRTYFMTKKPHGSPGQLIETDGMSSGINVRGERDKIFVTAISETSAPQIKLSDKNGKIIAKKNIGVVGYSGKFGNVNVSVRKSLINAQYQVAEIFSDNPNALKILEPLVISWENFISGSISFDDYQKILRTSYIKLGNNVGSEYLRKKNIFNYKKLQYELNSRLLASTNKEIETTIDLNKKQKLFHDFFAQVQSAAV